MYASSPGYENIKTVFTIHNIQYQGTYGKELINEVLGIPQSATSLVEYDGDVNFMKGAIETANGSYRKSLLCGVNFGPVVFLRT